MPNPISLYSVSKKETEIENEYGKRVSGPRDGGGGGDGVEGDNMRMAIDLCCIEVPNFRA